MNFTLTLEGFDRPDHLICSQKVESGSTFSAAGRCIFGRTLLRTAPPQPERTQMNVWTYPKALVWRYIICWRSEIIAVCHAGQNMFVFTARTKCPQAAVRCQHSSLIESYESILIFIISSSWTNVVYIEGFRMSQWFCVFSLFALQLK